MAIRIFLDTGVLVAYYCDENTGNNQKYLDSVKCFQSFYKKYPRVIPVISEFTLTEFAKVAQTKGIDPENIHQIIEDIHRQKRVGDKYKIELIPIGGSRKDYSFHDFFVHLQYVFLKAPRVGIADTMHYVIMENNRIKRIITTNEKDFSKLSKTKNLTKIRMEIIELSKASDYIVKLRKK